MDVWHAGSDNCRTRAIGAGSRGGSGGYNGRDAEESTSSTTGSDEKLDSSSHALIEVALGSLRADLAGGVWIWTRYRSMQRAAPAAVGFRQAVVAHGDGLGGLIDGLVGSSIGSLAYFFCFLIY